MIFEVMSDIILNMFSDAFLDEIFRLQELCSRRALRTIFERLAHTSIMRLNETSMDKVFDSIDQWMFTKKSCLLKFKLFDLMTMAVKYQVCLCSRPKEVFLITLNHFDSIREYMSDEPDCLDLLRKAYQRLHKVFVYSHLPQSTGVAHLDPKIETEARILVTS